MNTPQSASTAPDEAASEGSGAAPASRYAGLDRRALIAELERRDEQSVMGTVFERVDSLVPSEWQAGTDAPIAYQGKERLLVEKVNPVRLRPVEARSLNTGEHGDNLVIAGENLSVMRSLLLDHRGAVDVIYMDPPYNTGGDEFPYKDNFAVTREQLRALPRQLRERTSVVSAEDPNRHSKWVSHMAPRLFTARKLLARTGVIIVSIDEHELPRLWLLMDEMFGPRNRIATLIWEKSRKNDASYVSEGHEYILVYARSRADLDAERARRGKWREQKHGTQAFLGRFRELLDEHPDDLAAVSAGLRAFVTGVKRGGPFWTLRQYVQVDERSRELGPYKEEDPSWPGGGGPSFTLHDPHTGEPVKTPPKGWIFTTEEEARRAIDDGLFVWKRGRDGKPGIPKVKKYLLSGRDQEVFTSVQRKESRGAVMLVKSIFGQDRELFGQEGHFPNPKDHELLARLFRLATWDRPDALILDPYAGSGSTAHAVLDMNAADGGRRRFILIEGGFTGKGSGVSGAEYTHRITAERVRRVVTGAYASAARPGIPGGFTFMEADRKSISAKDILSADRERLSDIILQVAEQESNRIDCRTRGTRYLIGKTRSGAGIALCWEPGAEGRVLTMDKVLEIHREAAQAGAARPYHVYASANDAAYDDELYQFHQIPSAILARLGIDEEDE